MAGGVAALVGWTRPVAAGDGGGDGSVLVREGEVGLVPGSGDGVSAGGWLARGRELPSTGLQLHLERRLSWWALPGGGVVAGRGCGWCWGEGAWGRGGWDCWELTQLWGY
ncbi:hypothetical protein PLESTM_000789100 [Pleodorina starrii]|nr:hypothetical protein PLESTM_000789100 [Pleodorina starrii]